MKPAKSVCFAFAMLVVFGAAATTNAGNPKNRKSAPVKQAPFVPQTARIAAAKVLKARELQSERKYLEYVGTRITVPEDLKDVPESTQQTIAKELSELDLKPASRLEHFRWLLDRPKLRCNGWNGHLLKISSNPTGYLIEVAFTPALAYKGVAHTTASGIFYETYAYENGSFRFIRGTGPQSGAKMIFLD